MKRTIAVILTMALVCCLFGCGAKPVAEEAAPNELPPQVMVDGVIYIDTGIESAGPKDTQNFDGKILTTVSGDKQPTKNDQSNFGTGYGYQLGETKGTLDVYINEKWWTYATEEVRNQLQHPEQFALLGVAPILTVNYGEQSIIANEDGKYWEFNVEDGVQMMQAGVGAMGVKLPIITLNAEESMELWLQFEVMPNEVTMTCWSEETGPSTAETYQLTESNEEGDSYLLRAENGNYVYEIIAVWKDAPTFNGTVEYSFRTEV